MKMKLISLSVGKLQSSLALSCAVCPLQLFLGIRRIGEPRLGRSTANPLFWAASR